MDYSFVLVGGEKPLEHLLPYKSSRGKESKKTQVGQKIPDWKDWKHPWDCHSHVLAIVTLRKELSA